MKTLDPKSKFATLLLRKHLGIGYCAGSEFPGATIRKWIDKMFDIGFMVENDKGQLEITKEGHGFLTNNQMIINS